MPRTNPQRAVSISYFLFFASLGSLLPYITLYLDAAGWSGISIGIYAAIGPLVTFLTQPLWGYVGDLWGNLPRLFAILALASALSVFVFAFLPVSSVFFVLAVLVGLFQGPLSPVLDSMGVRMLSQKGKWGATRLWGSLGFAGVSVIVGAIFDQRSSIIFALYSLGIIITALWVSRLPLAAATSAKPRGFSLTGLARVLRGPFLLLLVTTFLLQFGHHMPTNFLSVVMAERGGSSALIGLAWSITALVEIPVLLGTIRMLDKLSPERLLIISGFVTALRLFVFAFSFNPLLMLVVHASKGLTYATTLVALVLIVDRIVPKEYHATGFTLQTAFTVTLPQLLGGLIGGPIYDAWTGTGLFLAGGSIALLGTVAVGLWHRFEQIAGSKKRSATAFVLILLVSVFAFPALSWGEELVILHTNDLHGQSLAKVGTLVAQLRGVYPDLLLVDAGDLFSGTPVSNLFQGEAEQTAVLTLGYDALAIGNHDFDFGLGTLQNSLQAGLPWLSANVLTRDGQTFAPPFLVRDVGGVRVLIVGLTLPSTPQMSFPRNVQGLTFLDPEAVLKEILQEQTGAFDICIVLSHLGYGDDLLLAQRVPGITAIIGGHSHTVLGRPMRIGGTLITQTGSSAEYLGKIVICTDGEYQARAELLEITEDIPPHPSLLAIDDYYEAILAVEMDRVLGYASRGYTKNGIGMLLTQALRDLSGADAALYNAGGVRAGLSQGAVTKGDVFTVEPFGNEAVVVTLDGPQFAELLEVKAKRSGDFYDGPKLIDLDRSYTVVTSDFLASAGSSYPVLAAGEILFLNTTVREVLEAYLEDSLEPLTQIR